MSIKPDKLLQRISELQKITAERTTHGTKETVYRTIQGTLETLEATLKQGKPVVQIVGEDLMQVQALRKLLKMDPQLETLYQIKAAALPALADPAQLQPALVLETTSESGTRYPLSEQPQTIGRHPDAELRLPDASTLVSGRHAELHITDLTHPREKPVQLSWEICDLNSRNGTYVNGERVRGCHLLQSGDLISLGSATATSGSIGFRFEQPNPSPSSPLDDEVYSSLFDADVLCLVVAPEPSFSLAAQQFLRQSHQSTAKQTVIVAMPGQTTERLMTNLSSLANWIRDTTSQATSVEPIEVSAENTIELVPLLLHSSTTPNATVLSPQAQPGFELFCQDLETLATTYSERLTERITATLNKQIIKVEQVLTVELEEVKQHLQLGTDVKTLDGLKEKFQRTITEVREDKDKVFKQIKQDLSQARAGILDSFSRKSILYQIQAFTDALNPSVLREGSYRRIHLQNGLTGADVQQEMHHLCRTTLVNWSNTEWQKINQGYAVDGIKGLRDRIQTALNQVALLKLDWVQEVEPRFDLQRILDNSIVEPDFETRYRGDSMKDYFMKQMRAPLMQFTFLSGALITIGTFLFWLLNSILQGATPAAPAAPASNTTATANTSTQYFSAIPADLKSPIAFIVVFLCISGLMYFFYSLYTNYQREEEFKREDAIAKIKKDLSNYYQSLAKSLVERLSQNLNLLLEAEEQKISKAIDRASDQLKLQTSDVKAQLDDYAKQQQKLNEARLKLEKLKGS